MKILSIIALLAIFYPAISMTPTPIRHLKVKTQDLLYGLRYMFKKPPIEADKIVTVAIDDESFRVLDKRWPWPRSLFALLIERLNKLSPALICLDVTFVGEDIASIDQEWLAKAIREAGNVIISAHFGRDGRYVIPDKPIREAALTFGFVNKPRDVDHNVRRTYPIMLAINGNVIDYSFALKIAAKSLGFSLDHITYDAAKRSVILNAEKKEGAYIIQLDRDRTIVLNYLAKQESFATIPFWQVIKETADPQIFKDKIVLVGMTSEVLHDIYETPLGLMPGVSVSANEILMYLSKDFIKTVRGSIDFWIRLIFAISVLAITYRFGMHKGFLTLAGLVTIAFLLNLYLFFRNYTLDFFGVFFTAACSYLITFAYNYIWLIMTNIKLHREAITDGLTGLYIYRYFTLVLLNEFNKSKVTGNPLALLILDIDDFKKINDTYSHQVGNLVLKGIADLLNETSRKTDFVFRYGGEEFCIITTNTELEGAVRYAEKIRRAVEAHDFITPEKTLKVTISIGIASTQQQGAYNEEELIKRADSALYAAKREGKNRALIFNGTSLQGGCRPPQRGYSAATRR